MSLYLSLRDKILGGFQEGGIFKGGDRRVINLSNGGRVVLKRVKGAGG